MTETNGKNIRKGAFPKWIYKIAGMVGLLLLIGVAYQTLNEENKELKELRKTPMTFNFNPAENAPETLEFKLLGMETESYRGLLLTNIKMSDRYPGTIESGIVKNIGDSDLIISNLKVSGTKEADRSEVYTGYFTIPGYETDQMGMFQSRVILGQGEGADVRFEFEENGGKTAYHPEKGLADKVYLMGNAKETGAFDLELKIKDAMSNK